jgi:hypothetical protein
MDMKNDANNLFKQKKQDQALEKYTEALDALNKAHDSIRKD